MNLNILNIATDYLAKLKKLVKYNRDKGVYLQSGVNSTPLPNFWLVVFFIIYTTIIIFIRNWTFYFYLAFSGAFLSYFLINQILYYYYWYQLGKNSVLFDSYYFISVKNKFLQFIPLVEFEYSDIDLGNIRFHFSSKSILQPLGNIDIEQVSKFQSLLENYSQNLKQTKPNNDYPNNFKYTIFERIGIKKYRLLASFFITIILFLGLPYIIDYNSFQFAKSINTATAYRTYLSENKNVRYREDARTETKKIYDKYITKYKKIALSESSGTDAIVETLKYLRDKNIYSVNFQFSSESLLNDFSSNRKNFKVIHVSPSFTKEKNQSRENAVFETIKSSFGNIFPADIFNLSNNNKNFAPTFKVYYTYKNSESLYYNVNEQNIPDSKKTFYYGIEIEWWFKIFLPKKENASYEFKLTSTPAQQFSSESDNSDAVYTNMAKSAFNDFQKEFYNQFLRK